jgi:hypothetical protein
MKNKVCLGVGTCQRDDNIRKVFGRMNVVYYVLMYENGKMRPIETIPGRGG